MSVKRIPIGLVGYGTVGQGVAAVLANNADEIARKLNARIELGYIVEKYPDREFDVPPPNGATLSDQLDGLLQDKHVEIAIELVGGTTAAKTIVEELLKAGKHVVTANKALLAHHGPELFALARRSGRCIAFEASCAGGIPLIESIRRGLAANRITALYGIVNGTCNYILSAMVFDHKSYDQALGEAQAAGFAEADPTLDVNGTDSAHKLAILSSLAFGQAVPLEAIWIEGIDSVNLADLEYAKELGYVMKLLAIGVQEDGGISVRVHPAFIHRRHPLAWVSGPFNAVSIYGNAIGHAMFYGRGAGRMPTASAVIGDVIDIVLGNAQQTFDRLAVLPDQTPAAKIKPIEQIISRYYLRLMVVDRPGVLAKLTEVFGRYRISITAVQQREGYEYDRDGEPIVPVVVLTHNAREGNMRRAIAEIAELDAVAEQPVCIRVVDEHPEWVSQT
jgi:homoserine dehydrogenase